MSLSCRGFLHIYMITIIDENDRKICTTFFGITNILIFIIALSALNAKEVQIVEPINEQVIHEDITIPFRTTRPSIVTLPKTLTKKLLDPEDISKRITPWEGLIQKYAKQFNINPNLIRAIIYVESKGNPLAVSHKGALGLMQIMPATGNFMGIKDLMKPDRNVEAGVKYIAWLLYHKKEYDEECLLWAWNAGMSRVEKGILPCETRNFIIQVKLILHFLENT